MKRVALMFVLAVVLPSLLLAWLAVRSVRDQEYVLEHQQSLLYQALANNLARQMSLTVEQLQTSFHEQVNQLTNPRSPGESASEFDQILRQQWPYAEVGFVVTPDGEVLCPSPLASFAARKFRLENDRFLSSRESVEVYYNNLKAQEPSVPSPSQPSASLSQAASPHGLEEPPPMEQVAQNAVPALAQKRFQTLPLNQARQVIPEKQWSLAEANSRLTTGTARFGALVNDSSSGLVARFLQDQLTLLFYHQPSPPSGLVFGAQINLDRLIAELGHTLQVPPHLVEEVCVALLNEKGQPVARNPATLQTEWKRPFVAAELGEFLPHWELGVYLLNPAQLHQSARTLRLTLGLVITLLLLAILIGGWLLTADVKRQLNLARQKTDFVGNVSHELKTPLTSIRMFAELLADQRVTDPQKQVQFLRIITAESERLTRLINNVLDFARIERGEKSYDLHPCDLNELVQEVASLYRPHLEAAGFQLQCRLTSGPLMIQADRDAIAQVLVNLLSNAEKYSEQTKTIEVQTEVQNQTACVRVLDRGRGVPAGLEEKIFHQFYRAHDTLNSGVRGVGLGLTLARQIARAHGGEVRCQPRPGGGACFLLELTLTGSPQTPPPPPASWTPEKS